MSDRKLFFFEFCLNFLMFYKKKSAFYFCVKVNFSVHFSYYFGNDLDVRNSNKNLLKTLK